MPPKPAAEKAPVKAAPARGRTVTSKPLDGSTASSRAKQSRPGATTGKGLLVEKKVSQRISPNASSSSGASLKTSERGTDSVKPSGTPTNDAKSSEASPVVKPETLTLKSDSVSTSARIPSSSAASDVKPSAPPPPPPQAPAPSIEDGPTQTSDPLQVAAQLYPWLYMTSTLEACFQTSEKKAKKDLEERSAQLEEEESDTTGQRVRFDAERAVDFYDELATGSFAKEAPIIMQTFLSHGDACTRVEAEALQLATHDATEPDHNAPLQVYNDMLDTLEELYAEAVNLESSILHLTSSPSSSPETAEAESSPPSDSASENTPHSQILGVFSACLPVIRARISNLSMAQDLIDGAQENLSISLRMESLGLVD